MPEPTPCPAAVGAGLSVGRTNAPGPAARRALHGFFRTAGACLGAFAILNAAGDLFIDRFGADFLWISFPGPLAVPGRMLLVCAAVALVWTAFRPLRNRRVALAVRFLLWGVAVAALWNALGFWWMLVAGEIRSWFPVPSSLAVAAVVAVNAMRIRRESEFGARVDAGESRMRLAAIHGLSFLAVAVAGPLLLLLVYGATDYSAGSGEARPATDCIIVYGAKVYADGTPSLSLSDRVREGVRLWKSGKGRFLLLSGGLGSEGHSEPEVMQRLAISAGVDAAAIVLDESGANTWLSAVGASRVMRERGWRTSLSVSHYFHLLRIQLSARRAGLRTLTVPAPMTRRLAREPWFVLRECAAFYGYFFFRWSRE